MIRLCLEWNRVDIARKFIFTSQNKASILSLDSLMEDAIIKNRVQFVELFLENGYNLKSYLTYSKLLNLYNSIPANSDLYKLLYERVSYANKNSKENAGLDRICYTFKDIGSVTQKLLNYLYEHRFTESPFSEISSHKARQVVTKNKHGIKLDKIKIHIWIKSKKTLDGEYKILDKKCEQPEHELFMFNILLQRYDMAMIFWREGKVKNG
jgi:transient receptor potential cation channel subfamily M protein 5